jgi:hypothetical protein
VRGAEEWPYKVELVPLSMLVVDDTYQRPPHRKFIADMVDSFDESLVGVLDVSERANIYAILDGQQRFMTMQQKGKHSCYCAVYGEMEIPDEAAFFYKKNRDRMGMGAYYGFRARVVAGDLNASQIQEAVEKQGFVLSDSTNNREAIGAVSAVEIVWGYDSQLRDECLTPVLETVQGGAFGRKDSLHSSFLQGLGRFWQAFADEEVDKPVLHSIISQFGPTALLGMAKEKRVVTSTVSKGQSIPWLVARVLSEEYNRSKRGQHRGRTFGGRLPIERLGV